MSSRTVVDPVALLPQLLAENAELKSRINLPEHERVLQSVLHEELHAFFHTAQKTLESAMSHAVALGGDVAAPDGSPLPNASALIETLQILGAQNETLQRQLSETQTTQVATLNAQVESLLSERDVLQERVRQLEDEVTAATAVSDKWCDNTNDNNNNEEEEEEEEEEGREKVNKDSTGPPASLLCELRALRASEAVLRRQLEELQQCSAVAAAEAANFAHSQMDAAISLPPLLEQLEAVRGELRAGETVQEVLRLELSEAEARAEMRHHLREVQLTEEATLWQSTANALRRELANREAQLARLAQQRTTDADRIAQLESRITELQTRRVEDDETLASKRRRFEHEVIDNPDSVRREFLSFWCEGRDELERLRAEVSQLREKDRQLHVTQERLMRLERNRGTVTGKLVNLAEEIGRLREENQVLRAQLVGVEVERDYLRSSLADALVHEMDANELQRCAEVIRQAAEKASASSSSVVADPQAIQQAMRQAQELRNDVAQLTREKEKLQHYIALREERICALHTKEALLRSSSGKEIIATTPAPTASGGGGGGGRGVPHQGVVSSSLSASPPLMGTPTSTPLSQTLALATASAHDALNAMLESKTEGNLRRREAFTAMQQRLLELEAQLRVCQQRLEQTTVERDASNAQLAAMVSETQETFSARESAMSEVLRTNQSLLHMCDALRGEGRQLRGGYDAVSSFARRLTAAMDGMLALLRAESSLAAALHDALLRERAETAELTRRAANAWAARDDEVQRVLDAMERMGTYLEQATAQQQRARATEETAHVCRLLDAVRGQEGRLKELQEHFTKACREFGEELAQRVGAAQKSGDTQWRRRVEALMEERQRMQAQLGAEKVLLARIERVVAAPPPPPSTIPALSQPPTTPSDAPDGEHNEVLEAIHQLLMASAAAVQQNPVMEPEREETVHNEEKDENEEVHKEKERKEPCSVNATTVVKCNDEEEKSAEEVEEDEGEADGKEEEEDKDEEKEADDEEQGEKEDDDESRNTWDNEEEQDQNEESS